jgi:hypothetical protein
MIVEKRTTSRKRAKGSRPPPLERLDDDWFDLAGAVETPRPPDYEPLSSATLLNTPFAISDVASSARRS